MSGIEFLWTLPAHDERPYRFTFADYAVQIARAADLAGFAGLLLPDDPDGDDPWMLASAIARETRYLRLVPAFSPGFASTVYAAKLAFTFQRFFADRLDWFVQLEPANRTLDEHVAHAREFLTIAAGVWGETPFDFSGRFSSVEGAALFGYHAIQDARVGVRRFPSVYASGEDDLRLAFSAAHADVHLFDTIDHAALSGLIARHRALSAAAGRAVRYGLRLAVAAGEYESDARHGVSSDYAYANTLVGTYGDVAEQLNAYAALGIETFALDAAPRLEGSIPSR